MLGSILDFASRIRSIFRLSERFEKLGWKFVNAYGPQQSLAPYPMTHREAVKFCREILGHSYVMTDFSSRIIFFAGPKHSG